LTLRLAPTTSGLVLTKKHGTQSLVTCEKSPLLATRSCQGLDLPSLSHQQRSSATGDLTERIGASHKRSDDRSEETLFCDPLSPVPSCASDVQRRHLQAHGLF
ncbi:hypothetical protein HAX54_011257, partial [Datura stramonium]|nr:hypothetical protein [Datura stramonium]